MENQNNLIISDVPSETTALLSALEWMDDDRLRRIAKFYFNDKFSEISNKLNETNEQTHKLLARYMYSALVKYGYVRVIKIITKHDPYKFNLSHEEQTKTQLVIKMIKAYSPYADKILIFKITKENESLLSNVDEEALFTEKKFKGVSLPLPRKGSISPRNFKRGQYGGLYQENEELKREGEGESPYQGQGKEELEESIPTPSQNVSNITFW